MSVPKCKFSASAVLIIATAARISQDWGYDFSLFSVAARGGLGVSWCERSLFFSLSIRALPISDLRTCYSF